MRNIWIRIGIIALVTSLTVLLFDKFENDKMQENLAKFLKIDKYKKEIIESEKKLASSPGDSSLTASLESATSKLKKVTPLFDSISPMLHDYDNLGAAFIAEKVDKAGWLNDVAVSKLKDEVRNANDYLVLESKAITDAAAKKEYAIAKESTEEYKSVIKSYLKADITLDSTMIALDHIYPILPRNHDKVVKKLSKFDIAKSFKKDIEKADNSIIVWGIIGAALLFCMIYLYVEKVRTPTAFKMANMFKKLQLFSSAAFSIGHGGNDAQKVMGIIGAALIASGSIQDFSQLPAWVPVACYLAIGLGTMSGGWKIVKTMGTKITKVTPLEGVSAETAGAFTLFFTGQMGIPVSTTHTITGSIIGVGATKRLSAVRWGVTVNLLWAWILTIPVSAILAAITYWIVTLFL